MVTTNFYEGYVVFAKYDPLSAVDGVSFIIQSPKTPDFVDVKISAWLENDWSVRTVLLPKIMLPIIPSNNSITLYHQ